MNQTELTKELAKELASDHYSEADCAKQLKKGSASFIQPLGEPAG